MSPHIVHTSTCNIDEPWVYHSPAVIAEQSRAEYAASASQSTIQLRNQAKMMSIRLRRVSINISCSCHLLVSALFHAGRKGKCWCILGHVDHQHSKFAGSLHPSNSLSSALAKCLREVSSCKLMTCATREDEAPS